MKGSGFPFLFASLFAFFLSSFLFFFFGGGGKKRTKNGLYPRTPFQAVDSPAIACASSPREGEMRRRSLPLTSTRLDKPFGELALQAAEDLLLHKSYL